MKNHRNGYIKIGFSVNPKAREKTLQSEEPEIELLEKWPASMVDEMVLHQRYAAKRIRGEWFKIDAGDIAIIESLLKK